MSDTGWILIFLLAGAIFFIIMICNYCSDKKKKIKSGRLTNEIIDFLKTNNRYERLNTLSIYPTAVSANLRLLVHGDDQITDKSFQLAKRLSSFEMSTLASCVCDALGKEKFEVKHHDASNGGSYTPKIGSVDGKTIYGETEYYDGWDEHIIIALKKDHSETKPKFTGGSNW